MAFTITFLQATVVFEGDTHTWQGDLGPSSDTDIHTRYALIEVAVEGTTLLDGDTPETGPVKVDGDAAADASIIRLDDNHVLIFDVNRTISTTADPARIFHFTVNTAAGSTDPTIINQTPIGTI